MKSTIFIQVIGKAFLFLLLFSIFTGFLYTLAVTGIGQLLFPWQANGSVIEAGGRTYGSALIAQPFSGNGYLWGRAMNIDVSSFTDENGAPVMYAWASNLSPASPEYEALIAGRVAALKASNPDSTAPVPVDLVTVSGSGLDPAISPDAALWQVPRIAKARGISEEEVRSVIERYTTGRFLGLMGEPTVNVLKVNLALDGILEGTR